ncbi:metallophosphoesterase family protein [Bacteroides cellulosilyticus]|uniref:metallophosphoesterase family protein n=1 Tax=Bacteroides cellulosilyticus TaxID=246787 RepID=UPI0035671BF9
MEVFSSSQRRLAILTDPHLDDNNKHECTAFLDAIVKLQNRPDFIVVCGDLTANNKSDERKLVENNLIGGLETRNFSVCEGLGNHDVRHFTFDGGMTDYVKNRKREADGKLINYDKDKIKKLHYRWDFLLSKDDYSINVYCFMLNLVPGYGELLQVKEYGKRYRTEYQ